MGEGLVIAEGEIWKRHRKIISTLFNYDFLKSQIPVIMDTSREFLDKLSNENLNEVKILDEFQRITGEAVDRVFFGTNVNSLTIDGEPLTMIFAKLIEDAIIVPSKMILGEWLYKKTPSAKILEKRLIRFRQVIFDLVRKRKTELENQKIDSDKKNLLDLLLEYQDKGNGLTEKEIVDEFISFLGAGMDTTAHLVTMIFYNLYNQPEYLKQIENEVEMHYKGTIPEEMTNEILNKLDVTQLVIKETLRLHNPATNLMPREVIKSHKLGNINLKCGDLVGIHMNVNFSNPKYFENPEKFQPERFVESVSGKMASENPFLFIPFSAGPRNCIGQHMSSLQTKIIVSEFLMRFNYKVSRRYKHAMAVTFTYGPNEPMLFDLQKKV